MKARPESDEVLVQRLLPRTNGDPKDRASAWGEWYMKGGKSSVLAFIRTKNDTSEPDMDILQEAMITAYVEVERGSYRPYLGVPFVAFVKGIARNKIREARRRARRFVPLLDVPEHLAKSDDLPLEAVLERRERRAFLLAGLTELSPYRRYVLEGYLKGHSTAEIARALGMSEALVRQHKCRGLRDLRRSRQRMPSTPSYG